MIRIIFVFLPINIHFTPCSQLVTHIHLCFPYKSYPKIDKANVLKCVNMVGLWINNLFLGKLSHFYTQKENKKN